MKVEDRNFYLGVVNGALFTFASVFISGNIVMPLFLKSFTDSKTLIGLASAILSVGWHLPQFFEGYFSEREPSKMSIYRFAAWLRISSFAILIFAILIFANMKNNFAIAVIMALIIIYSLSGGISGLAFMDIVARTVSSERRGYYFGYRLLFGGLLALGGSLIVSYILDNEKTFQFPFNFVILFTIAFILISAAFLSFMRVIEPPGGTIRIRTFKEYVKEAMDNLKCNYNYRGLIVSRYLCGATSIAFPFYILYGIEFLNFPKSIIGAFLLSQVIGSIISNLLWGYFGEKDGNKLILQIYAVLSLGAPLIAILSTYFEVWKQLYIFIFLLLGFTDSGGQIGFLNFLLEISPAEKRASSIGFMHTFTAPVLLIPALGGFLLDNVRSMPYNFIFLFALVFGLFGMITTFRLREPRRSSS